MTRIVLLGRTSAQFAIAVVRRAQGSFGPRNSVREGLFALAATQRATANEPSMRPADAAYSLGMQKSPRRHVHTLSLTSWIPDISDRRDLPLMQEQCDWEPKSQVTDSRKFSLRIREENAKGVELGSWCGLDFNRG
ncbi:hypothetical protein CIHG_04087 [Coccidioides immitis H538.4]|uniref:Uncharacterized protein n=2 Tax=Coccidioides immitis TaxID=5501 RepID=A0A0J8UFY1_COCIT|nr:hypothetical protein CIRG_04485 [Coccidioides immitis RMSCC 2394]KMU86298.1 hypothetical protein CIHG_04087 [Coccidioides immitis H538.4]